MTPIHCWLHKMDRVHSRMTADDTISFLLSGNYIIVLQPCDVGINDPLKNLPSPKRIDVL